MGFLVITLIVLAVMATIFLKASLDGKADVHKQQQIHFELLDDDGEPLPNYHQSVRRQPIEEPKVRRLRYFCVKDKGYHVSVWPKDQGMQNLDYIEFNIAGLSYRDNIEDYLGEHAGRLEAEPSNPYDHNAIKILAGDSHHVGYIPKDMTAEIRRHTSLPCKCYFYIGENDGAYFSDCYIKL